MNMTTTFYPAFQIGDIQLASKLQHRYTRKQLNHLIHSSDFQQLVDYQPAKKEYHHI